MAGFVLEIGHVTGFAGLATVKADDEGAAVVGEDEQASRNAAKVGNAAAVAKLLPRNARRFSGADMGEYSPDDAGI